MSVGACRGCRRVCRFFFLRPTFVRNFDRLQTSLSPEPAWRRYRSSDGDRHKSHSSAERPSPYVWFSETSDCDKRRYSLSARPPHNVRLERKKKPPSRTSYNCVCSSLVVDIVYAVVSYNNAHAHACDPDWKDTGRGGRVLFARCLSRTKFERKRNLRKPLLARGAWDQRTAWMCRRFRSSLESSVQLA